MPARTSRRGVTLLELLVALAISGAAMLGGLALLDQVHDGGARIATNGMLDARIANGDRLLRRLLIDARASTDTSERFRGDEQNASFLTLCDQPSGWAEPCRALLSINSVADSSDIVAHDGHAAMYAVRRIAGPAVFRYLDATAAPESAWVGHWIKTIALPAGIAVITASDTTVLPMGSVHE